MIIVISIRFLYYNSEGSMLRGIKPSRCARISSGMTDVLFCIRTVSTATVGTSAIKTRRKAFTIGAL